MVWIIPQDSDDAMFKQLICLMTNIETGRHVFNEEMKLAENNKPFNTYETDAFTDEYRFVKGYIRCTGAMLSPTNIEPRMESMNSYMRDDISVDINYCHPTSHYTVARIPITKEYSRLVAYSYNRLKNIRYKYNFIWVLDSFGLVDFNGLKSNKNMPDTYELMRSLSTIIYDNAGIFSCDHNKQPLISGKLCQHINFPEINQIHGSERIVNIPVKLSKKFNIRQNISKKFFHLIPDLKKFSLNRALYKNKTIEYRSGEISENSMINVIEKKELKDLNIPAIDKKESIIKKIKTFSSLYELIKLNLTSINKNQLSLDLTLKYLCCHTCFTPLYGLFYYIIIDHKLGTPQPHIPICALCMHNSESKIFGTISVGISESPLTVYDVLSLVPKPVNVSYYAYEKYKNLLMILFNEPIEVTNKASNNIIYSGENYVLVDELNLQLLTNPFNKDITIFIVELI